MGLCMCYRIKNGLITRDIGGIIFLVDIHEKDYGKNKEITVLNQVGLIIIEKMINLKVFKQEDILKIIYQLFPTVSQNELYEDVCEFFLELKNEGYIEEIDNNEGTRINTI